MAMAGARFTDSVLQAAFGGKTGIVEPTYVYSDAAKKDGVEWFATNVELGVRCVCCSALALLLRVLNCTRCVCRAFHRRRVLPRSTPSANCRLTSRSCTMPPSPSCRATSRRVSSSLPRPKANGQLRTWRMSPLLATRMRAIVFRSQCRLCRRNSTTRVALTGQDTYQTGSNSHTR